MMAKNNDRIYVDPIMKFYIEQETKRLAEKIKKQHGLKKLTIPLISGSQWLGNFLLNKKGLIKYKVRKTSLNEGVIEFL